MIKIKDKQEFINICNQSKSMAEACSKLNIHFNTFARYAKKFGCYNPNQCGKNIIKNRTPIFKLEDILNNKYPHFNTYKLKNRLIKAKIKENKCECCGIVSWNNKPLNMQLDHIDGNRFNHCLKNLKMLCPNCHAQTDTFRAKNIKKNGGDGGTRTLME